MYIICCLTCLYSFFSQTTRSDGTGRSPWSWSPGAAGGCHGVWLSQRLWPKMPRLRCPSSKPALATATADLKIRDCGAHVVFCFFSGFVSFSSRFKMSREDALLLAVGLSFRFS